jgi:hypothetical protein
LSLCYDKDKGVYSQFQRQPKCLTSFTTLSCSTLVFNDPLFRRSRRTSLLNDHLFRCRRRTRVLNDPPFRCSRKTSVFSGLCSGEARGQVYTLTPLFRCSRRRSVLNDPPLVRCNRRTSVLNDLPVQVQQEDKCTQ